MTVASQFPSSAMAVANWFLQRSWQETEQPHCDQMKLYKLVYYAQAWHLGNVHRPLFEEDVEAWPHGPVIRALYSEFMRFGRGPITELGKRLEPRGSGDFGLVVPEHEGSLEPFFESIWRVYGDKTGIQLSNMTHAEGEPWTIVAQEYGFDLSRKPTIPSQIIEAVFERKVAERAA